MGLFSKVIFSFSEESEVGVSLKDVFETRKDIRFGLNKFSSWALLPLVFLLEFLGDFGYEE